MGLKRKLKKWEDAALLSNDQAEEILRHEKQGTGKTYFRGLVGLALLIIFGGAAMIIESNWAAIPGNIKIITHFAINAIVAYVMYTGQQTNHFWKREGAAFILAGLNVTLIALIGQVFQLNGSVEGLLLLWLLITTPFIFIFGLSRMNAILWTLGFIITCALNLNDLIDKLDFLNDAEKLSLYTFLGVAIPALLLIGGINQKLQIYRQEWQQSYLFSGAAIIIAIGLFTSLSWYDQRLLNEYDELKWFPAFNAVFWSAFFFGVRQITESTYYKALLLMASLTMLFLLVVCIPGRPESDLMSTVHFVIYAGLIGYFAVPLALPALITVSILLITIRLFIFYLEVTNNMAQMGVGMLVSGIVLLIGLKLSLKINKTLKAKLFGEGAKS